MSDIVDIEDILKDKEGNELNQRKERGSNEVRVKQSIKKLNKKNIESVETLEADYLKEVPGRGSVYVKTFGCSHNISDSEFMMGQLSNYGYQLAEQVEQADLVLINSCTVKNPSQDAFVNWVKGSQQRGQKVVVAGCVPQGQQGLIDIQEVSVVGVTQIDRVVEVVQETFKGNTVRLLQQGPLPSLDLPKIRKNQLVEIIPINAGCLGACTYCKTVQARGKLGSYSLESILERVDQVIQEGVMEIWLTSEDTGAWGRDLGSNISVLLKHIVQRLPSQVMLRVGMTNPPYILAHLESIASILNHPQVYSFLHIPVQAGNNQVLNQMNREYTVEEFRYCCDQLLQRVPDMTIATDIICGFPGETDEQYEHTMQLCRHYKFRVLNISQFYPRPGTPAFKMKRVNTKTVKSRSRMLTELFESYPNWTNWLNQTVTVLVTEIEDRKGIKNAIGHTKNYAKVVLQHSSHLLGKWVKVKVTKVTKWHLEGQVVDEQVTRQKVDNQLYFTNYNEVGETKREAKYQAVIKARLNRNNDTQNQEHQIYTKFDLQPNAAIQDYSQDLQHNYNHNTQLYTKQNTQGYMADINLVLGIFCIVLGILMKIFL